ncbi:MAG: CHAT domain-containing protein [Anaerolineae bacterium]|nr:CHAT domain-containing protein [Anaerolineae bacterium]
MSQQRTADTLRDPQSRLLAPRPINIDLNNDRLTVFKKRFVIKYNPDDVQDLNERFVEILEQVRIATAKQNLNTTKKEPAFPLPEIENYLNQLRDLGTEAYALLPEDVFEYLEELEWLVQKEEPGRKISLDFTFPADMALMWEMIYTGDPLEPVEDITKFWGFRYPIGHLDWDLYFGDSVQLRKGALALAHSDFATSNIELAQLKQHLDSLTRYAQRQFILHQLEDIIAHDDLCSESVLQYFGDTDFIYGLVHFVCHCVNPGRTGASRAYLSLKSHQKEIQLSLGKFNALGRKQHGFGKRPLIFLNACESATPLHLQSLNLPTAMLNFGAGGVIATVCALPDNFASAFAAEFYKCLLGKPLASEPASIGKALLETRLHFMQKPYQNPLGLAYGLYALSSQWLRLD